MGNEQDANIQKTEPKKKGKTLDERLEAQERKLENDKLKLRQLQALKQQREARKKAKLDKAERAKDTRKKILLGAVVLGRVSRGEWTDERLADLTQELTRDDDRALFGLPPLHAETK